MKILATSDLHGYLPKFDERFDLLLIAGDVCPSTNHNSLYQKRWMRDDFTKWVVSLPFKDSNSKVILTPGNHDFCLEQMSGLEILEIESICGGRLKILRHDIYEHEYAVSDGLDSLKIFGTPYCSIFGNWAFMINDDALDRKFSQIPEDVDILISHDSPNVNRLGAILEGPWKSDTTGNTVLPEHIKRVKPKIFVSGHFHSGNHIPETIDGTLMANVSFVNEDYDPEYGILSIEYDEENRKVCTVGFVNQIY